MQDVVGIREDLTIIREKWKDEVVGWRWRTHNRSWRLALPFMTKGHADILILRGNDLPELLTTAALVRECQRVSAVNASGGSGHLRPDVWAARSIATVMEREGQPVSAARKRREKLWLSAYFKGERVSGITPVEAIDLLESAAKGRPISAATAEQVAERLPLNDETVYLLMKTSTEVAVRPTVKGAVCYLGDDRLRLTVPTSAKPAASTVALKLAAEIVEASQLSQRVDKAKRGDHAEAPPDAEELRDMIAFARERVRQIQVHIRHSTQRHGVHFWPEEPRFAVTR